MSWSSAIVVITVSQSYGELSLLRVSFNGVTILRFLMLFDVLLIADIGNFIENIYCNEIEVWYGQEF